MGSNYRPEEGYLPPDTSQLDASANWPRPEPETPPVPARKKASPVVILLALLCAGLIVGIAASSTQYQDEVYQLQSRLNSANSTISDLQAENARLEQAANFLDQYIVIISDDGTNLYHRYGCEDLDTSYFWAYNINAATGDYDPCPVCYPDATE